MFSLPSVSWQRILPPGICSRLPATCRLGAARASAAAAAPAGMSRPCGGAAGRCRDRPHPAPQSRGPARPGLPRRAARAIASALPGGTCSVAEPSNWPALVRDAITGCMAAGCWPRQRTEGARGAVGQRALLLTSGGACALCAGQLKGRERHRPFERAQHSMQRLDLSRSPPLPSRGS